MSVKRVQGSAVKRPLSEGLAATGGHVKRLIVLHDEPGGECVKRSRETVEKEAGGEFD